MKKLIPILILGFIFTSCEPEEQIVPGELNTPEIDSSTNKEHNLVWNGQYYQLEFDYAVARIANYNGIVGTGYAFIMFDSYFKDKKTNLRFKLTCGTGISWHGDSNYLNYYTPEVQNHLDAIPGSIIHPFENQPYPIGSRFSCVDYGSRLFPIGTYDYNTHNWTYTPVSLELISYNIYFDGQDKMMDYTLKITSSSVQGIISGKFRAQHP